MSGVPIACSLDGNEARRRWQEWRAVMGHHIGIARSPGRLTVRFSANEVLVTQLEGLVAAERQCCSFVDWELEDLGKELSLTVRGDQDGVAAMAESLGA